MSLHLGAVTAALAILLLTSGCSRHRDLHEEVAGVSVPVPTASAVPSPTLQEAANATYVSIHGVGEITLREGRWDGPAFIPGGASRATVGLVQDFFLHGDLDGDDSEETIVFLWSTTGGSGTFNHLAVLGRHDNAVVNLGSALIGDRIQLRTGRIRGRMIELDVVQSGPGDAACCPSHTATRVWSLQTNGLKEGPALATGTRSLTDLRGVVWVLKELQWNEPVAAPGDVTLRFDGHQISGKSSCNRYFAEVRTGEMPGDLSVQNLRSTRMVVCPEDKMSLEKRYLQALRNTTNHSFIFGRLALTWRQDNTVHTMRFSPRSPQ
jgi:heat shock protein HslJ